jgi:hypothetical protein
MHAAIAGFVGLDGTHTTAGCGMLVELDGV